MDEVVIVGGIQKSICQQPQLILWEGVRLIGLMNWNLIII
jgi:hypothetical protein